ncbi:MAG: dihydroorotase [Raineya sp.]|nr:dihydroorotase [Raineya sp.]MDW8296001.1 dihydroorotase [Raineya sp.]
MYSLFLSQALILDKNSPFHQQKKDILVQSGIIQQIGDKLPIPENTQVIQSENLCVSIGFVDLRCHVPDLGFEYKETLQTARQAAAQGGFTHICVLPNMLPALDSKDSVQYVLQNNSSNLVQTLPIGAVTLKTKGEDLSEMIDLHQAGAVAFSDGLQPIINTDILLKTLLYLQPLGALLLQRPEDTLLTRYGQMNEGIVATRLGLKGMPALAETLIIQRDLEILRYTGGKIHFSCISCAKSVELIRQAKAERLNVTCDVSALNLFFTEEVLQEFDTNFKLNPPLRTQADREALWQGIADDTIDAIVSDHQPQDTESKMLEFDLAQFGAINLQTAFLACNTQKNQVSLEKIIEKFAQKPREILGLPQPSIQVNAPADLCIFDSQQEQIFSASQIVSLSQNSPFVGEKLKGRILAVCRGDFCKVF